VNNDEYLQSLWDCINVNAVRRLGLSDHGRVHFAIVANIALKILRNLQEAKVEPSIVTDHKLTDDDAEVVVFLGAVLHDLGMIAHRENHHILSVGLAAQIIPRLLEGVYPDGNALLSQRRRCILSTLMSPRYPVHTRSRASSAWPMRLT